MVRKAEIKHIWLYCLIVLLSACTENDLPEITESDLIFVTATTEISTFGQRIAIDEENDIPVIKWEKGDTLGIFAINQSNLSYITADSITDAKTDNATDGKTDGITDAKTKGKFAVFSGYITRDKSYYAFYPYAQAKYKENVPMPDLSTQNVKSNDWTLVSKKLAFVGVHSFTPVDNKLNIVMEAVGSVMELRVKSEGQTFRIKGISMTSKNLISTPTINLASGTLTKSVYPVSHNRINVNVTDTPLVTNDKTTTVRFVFYPFTTENDLNINVITTSNLSIPIKIDSIPEKFNSGKRYIKTASLDITKAVSAWDGSIQAPTRKDQSGFTCIDNAAQLAWLAENHVKGGKYILTNDIDLSGLPWKPIGIFGKVFSGEFNGNGRTISGLLIDYNTCIGVDYLGLFGEVEQSEIMKITIKKSSIEAYSEGSVGAVVGVANNSNIQDCNNYCDITGHGDIDVGGVCGLALGTSTIRRCHNYGNIFSEGVGSFSNLNGSALAGGITSSGLCHDCTNYGNVKVKARRDRAFAAGITAVGIAFNCHNYGKEVFADGYSFVITGEYIDTRAAGITTSATLVESCSNKAEIFARGAKVYAGGIIAKSTSHIYDCSNKGSVTAILEKSYTHIIYAGGIVGDAGSSGIQGCSNEGGVFCSSDIYSDAFLYVGGISGDGGDISYCTNTSRIDSYTSGNKGYFYAGGIAGHPYSVKYSYSAANEISPTSGRYKGGIAGTTYKYNGIYACFWLYDNQGNGIANCSNDNLPELSTSHDMTYMKSQAFVDNLNNLITPTSPYIYRPAHSETENHGYPVVVRRDGK